MDPDAVVEQVRAGGLLAAGAPVVVLLSGGRDSVCLLDVAVRVAGAAAVMALHVNYGLRAEAGEDERHCAALCARLGVELIVERAGEPRGNVQAWARELRYAAAERIAHARDAAAGGVAAGDAARGAGPTTIAAGHTADDQVETILYRLAAAPSRRALLGMRPRDGRLVRPLLELTRAQTTSYCDARGLAWRDDVTNAGGRYARNRVRNELVGALREIHPAAEANVLALAAVLREEAELLDALVAAELAAPDASAPGANAAAPGSVPGRSIALDRLAALHPALRRLVVQRLADDAAGRPVGGAANRAEQVAALRRAGTAWLDLGGGVRAVAEYGVVRAELTPRGAEAGGPGGAAGARGAAVAVPPDPVALPIPGSATFGAWRVSCEASAPDPADGVLDRAALGGAGELLVRPWRAGDRIAPVGLGGSKSLQDLFTARRVPRARRALLPVVLCGEEVAWVPGVATSARFGVTAATRDAVRLSAAPLEQAP
ncbi:MAG TPA: tRNA lysidine(34) synthetase TilS [Conexibacter sp.]|nr:tRNA lysidine(34) synthetase TilS [Conexibacter sp.]